MPQRYTEAAQWSVSVWDLNQQPTFVHLHIKVISWELCDGRDSCLAKEAQTPGQNIPYILPILGKSILNETLSWETILE